MNNELDHEDRYTGRGGERSLGIYADGNYLLSDNRNSNRLDLGSQVHRATGYDGRCDFLVDEVFEGLRGLCNRAKVERA
jgi:hypothetical protein